MNQSLEKIQKILKLEIERNCDNRAVLGGLERMLDFWEPEARVDGIPEELIQVIVARIRDYRRLSPSSRYESLAGLWQRIQKSYPHLPQLPESHIPLSPEAPPQTIPERQTPLQPEQPSPTEAGEYFSPVVAPQPPADPGNGLDSSVKVMSGIGPQYEKLLERLGIWTLRDFMYHFPRRYDDYSRLKPINRLVYGEEVTVIGIVQNVFERSIRGGAQKITEAVVSDGSGSMRVTWFSPYAARNLEKGEPIVLSGKVEQYLGRIVMNNPEWEAIDQQQLSTNRIVPVYPLTARITQKWLRHQIDQVLAYWADRITDPLPPAIRQPAGLVDLSTALRQIHFPNTWDDQKKAQERLAFDEIFMLQLGVIRQKRAWQERSARSFQVTDPWLESRIGNLPFSLTDAQVRALNDIRGDLQSGKPMNRLIQGDVGSGKTVVAAVAMAILIQNGAQCALMAPTSILAEQHYRNLRGILAANQVESPESVSSGQPDFILPPSAIRILVGSTPAAEKAEILAGLADGSISLIVGTHALIEDPVAFKDLQLVVVDEQHRFGVEQRSALRQKGDGTHLMVMTATPIPRSLALTIYGDLDLSIIDEMPPGRQPISTFVLTPRERERAYSLIRGQVKNGQQVFIIYPLVEETEQGESKAAVEEFDRLQAEIFPELKVSLLHGRMRPDEKEIVMAGFRDGLSQILVSTSVIEVGMDIPNATVMLIEGANRFGLAQLHQFRGRVGRGAEKSYCLLIPDTPDEVENARLQVMTETNDGFVLAERDLEQRGPGQFLGTRQSGYHEFQLANMTDIRLIEKARRFAAELLNQDPDLQEPLHQPLVSALRRAWNGNVGDIS